MTSQQIIKTQTVLSFDGKNSYVQCGNRVNLANSSFTVEVWAKRSATKAINFFTGHGVDGPNKKLHMGFRAGDEFTLAFYGNDLNTATNVTDTQWHHWACVYDATTKKQLIYRDGEKITERVSLDHYQGTGVFYIGCYAPQLYHFFGELTEFRIWNKARTPEEIKATISQYLVGNEPGLIAYWPLNEGSGNIAADKTANANQGTIVGATWVQSALPVAFRKTPEFLVAEKLAAEKAAAYPKSVLAFDGQDDAVALGKKAQFKIEKNITLEAWVYAEHNQEWVGIFSNIYDTGSTESGYGLTLDGKGGIYLGMTPSSTQRIIYLSSGANTLTLNKWCHVAGTYDGQQMKVYIDGVLKATQAVSSPSISYNPENDLHIGVYKDNDEAYYLKGRILEVRLWNIARSPDDIQKTMQYRLMGNEPGLVGYWPLNESSGNTVSDKTTNRNQGTIMGATWVQSVLPVAFLKIPELLVAEKVAAEKEAAVAKATAQKALEEKAAADKTAAETKAAAQKALEEKATAEKATAEAKAATDKALADKALAEKEAAVAKAAAEKATADAKATTDKALADKALADKATAQSKATAEKDLTDKVTALAKATTEAQAAAQAKAAAEKAVAEKAVAETEAAVAKVAAEKAAADALAIVQKATALKTDAETKATQEAQAAAEAKALAEKALAEKALAETETAQAKATAEKAEAEAQAARAAKVIAQAQATARKAAIEAEIAEVKVAAAKKVEKAEAEAKAAEARAIAAEAAALAKEVEEKAKGVKPQANVPVSESDVDKGKEQLLNSTGREDYGYWWEQVLKQRLAEGDRTVHGGRI